MDKLQWICLKQRTPSLPVNACYCIVCYDINQAHDGIHANTSTSSELQAISSCKCSQNPCWDRSSTGQRHAENRLDRLLNRPSCYYSSYTLTLGFNFVACIFPQANMMPVMNFVHRFTGGKRAAGLLLWGKHWSPRDCSAAVVAAIYGCMVDLLEDYWFARIWATAITQRSAKLKKRTSCKGKDIMHKGKNES